MLDFFRSEALWASFGGGALVALAGVVVRWVHSRFAPKMNAWATTTAVASKKVLPIVAKTIWAIASRLVPIWFCVYGLREALLDPAPVTRAAVFEITFFFWLLMFFVVDIAFPHVLKKPATARQVRS